MDFSDGNILATWSKDKATAYFNLLYAMMLKYKILQEIEFICFWQRHCPLFFGTGSTKCNCQKEYPTFLQAYNGYSGKVIKDLAQSSRHKAKLRATHKCLMNNFGLGVDSDKFFEKFDPFESMIKDDEWQTEILRWGLLLLNWEPLCHNK